MIEDAELEGIARQAFNIVRHRMEIDGRPWLMASYYKDEGLRTMGKIEDLIEAKLGLDWLNCDHKKDAAFGILRLALTHHAPDAFVFVTAANIFTPTEKLASLPMKEQKEIMDGGHDKHHRAVANGYLKITDGFMSLAQTRERVCICSASAENPGSPTVHHFPQSAYTGRMKLYAQPIVQ